MNYLRREFFIFRYFLALLKRNFKKYFTVAGLTYFLGASGLYKSAKPAYFFCRYVDDLADGERPLPPGESFDAFIDRMLYLVDNPQKHDGKGLELTLIDALRKLEFRSPDKQTVKLEFKNFLRSMRKDYHRRVTQKALSQVQIDALYDESFSSVLHLALIGFNTRLERVEIGKLGLVQGKVYALEDMTEELGGGIINVPLEVIEQAGLTVTQSISDPELLIKSTAFSQWKEEELKICKALTEELLALQVNKKAAKMIRVLVKPLAKYVSDESERIGASQVTPVAVKAN